MKGRTSLAAAMASVEIRAAALKTQVVRANGMVCQVIEDCIGPPWSEATDGDCSPGVHG